jgi:hypothetical protein
MLTTNELHELLLNSDVETSLETAQGLEDSLSTKKAYVKDRELENISREKDLPILPVKH